MNLQRALALGAASLALAARPGTSGGEEVTWNFAGELTTVSDPNGHLGGSVTVGSLVSGSYTFDLSTPDDLPGDPTRGKYTDAITAVSGQVESLSFLGPAGPTNVVHVSDGYLGGDFYRLSTDVDLQGIPLELEITLSDPLALVFSSDGLPVEPPALEDLDYARIGFNSQIDEIILSGDLTSLVPEPATLLPVALGGAWAGRRRR